MTSSDDQDVTYFYKQWFSAIHDHDRAWLEDHLAEGYTEWFVPASRGILKAVAIELEMCVAGIRYEVSEVRTMTIGPYLIACARQCFATTFRPYDQLTVQQRELCAAHGIADSATADPSSSKGVPLAWTTTLRRVDSSFVVMHHALIGHLPTDHCTCNPTARHANRCLV